MAAENQARNPVAWGVLGASHFALMAAIPALAGAPLANLRAVSSRSLDKARELASRLGVARAYGSYEELVSDPEIEAVYNPLPNNLHVPWSIKAARAGKHVLCEKPIAMTVAEAKELVAVQRETKKLIAEAYMVRYHPQWRLVRQVIDSGRIGKVRAVQTAFSYTNTDPTNIRNQLDAGGGAIYDIGGYAITTARLVFGSEPERVTAVCQRDTQSGCDVLTSVILDFGAGHANFVVGTQHVPYQRVHVFGTQGHLEVEIPFNAPHDRPCRVFVDDGLVGAADFTVATSSDDRRELLPLAPANHYSLQWQVFSEAIRNGTPYENDVETALCNARVVEAVFRAAESGRWEPV